MIYVIYGATVLVAFLSSMNDFLRGSKTPQADEALTFIWVGLILAAFIIADWKSALIVFLGFLVIGGLSRPLAARVVMFIFKKREEHLRK
jgi:hypothetical protein